MSRFEKIDGVGDPIENSKKRQKDKISKTRLIWESNKKKFKQRIWPVWRQILTFNTNKKVNDMKTLKKKLKSEKFWEGVAAVAGSIGVGLNPEAAVEIGAAAVCIIGVIRAFSNNKDEIFKTDE